MGPSPTNIKTKPVAQTKWGVYSIPARILFDTGSNRSFVSTTFALHANRELVPLKNKLVVNTPLGEQILLTSVFKGCKIVVEGVVLKANLIPLEVTDFDVILGMDWLSCCHNGFPLDLEA